MINQILEQLAAEPGRNAKIDILKRHKGNDTLTRVIFLALDPFTQFYIRKIPAYTTTNREVETLEWALDRLYKLSEREVTGNAAIDHLKFVLESVSTEDAKVIERIIQKDLKCGVSEATVNKVWPDMIHEYPCMLASAYEQKLVDKMAFPAYAQMKMDGMRFNAIVQNGAVEFRSRNGKEIQIADPTFSEPFIYMAAGQDVVFDGELLIKDNGAILDRKTGNGILNKAVKGTQSEAEGKLVCCTLWDMIPMDQFTVGECLIPYQTRLRLLSSGIMHASHNRVHLVPTHEVSGIEEAQRLFQEFLSTGEEGIILKSKTMIWEDKRSKHQIKFKGELECDLKIVDWEEGTGKNKGRLGALVLESEDGQVRVGVGTGLTDQDRTEITRDVIGKIVAVKYNARIRDKRSAVDSLFLPVFLEIREDKTTADLSKDIK